MFGKKPIKKPSEEEYELASQIFRRIITDKIAPIVMREIEAGNFTENTMNNLEKAMHSADLKCIKCGKKNFYNNLIEENFCPDCGYDILMSVKEGMKLALNGVVSDKISEAVGEAFKEGAEEIIKKTGRFRWI